MEKPKVLRNWETFQVREDEILHYVMSNNDDLYLTDREYIESEEISNPQSLNKLRSDLVNRQNAIREELESQLEQLRYYYIISVHLYIKLFT